MVLPLQIALRLARAIKKPIPERQRWASLFLRPNRFRYAKPSLRVALATNERASSRLVLRSLPSQYLLETVLPSSCRARFCDVFVHQGPEYVQG